MDARTLKRITPRMVPDVITKTPTILRFLVEESWKAEKYCVHRTVYVISSHEEILAFHPPFNSI
jgi:hypothetical protein